MPTTVRILAADEHQRAVAQAALRFLSYSDLVVADIGEAPGPAEISVGGAGDLRLVDDAGRDWVSGRAAAEHIWAGADAITVHLMDREGLSSQGRVGVLRSVGATVAAGQAVLGPLIAAYAAGHLSPVQAVAGRSVRSATADRRAALRFLGRVARAAVTVRNWQVAEIAGGLHALRSGSVQEGPAVRWQGPTRRAFWADPCVVVAGGEQWLFVEELGRRSGMGVIRGARVREGVLDPQPVVLRTAHHLSFPQIYRVGSRWLATVETCAAENPIYAFDRLGDPWRPAVDMPAIPPHLADPVLEFDGEGLVGVSGTDATVNADAVFVRFTWDGQRWVRRDRDLFIDVRLARGGGTHDHERGLRAVQDCAGTYGRAASVVDACGNEVVRITADDLNRSPRTRHRKGVHTVSWSCDGEVVWIDGWIRRVTPLGGLLRLRERSHSARCEG